MPYLDAYGTHEVVAERKQPQRTGQQQAADRAAAERLEEIKRIRGASFWPQFGGPPVEAPAPAGAAAGAAPAVSAAAAAEKEQQI